MFAACLRHACEEQQSKHYVCVEKLYKIKGDTQMECIKCICYLHVILNTTQRFRQENINFLFNFFYVKVVNKMVIFRF